MTAGRQGAAPLPIKGAEAGTSARILWLAGP